MANNQTRLCMHAFCVICLLIGIGLTIASIFTSGWMIAWNRSYGEVVEHGLIRNCERFLRPMAVRPAGEFLCFWKFDRMIPNTVDDPYYPRQQQEHYFYSWQEQVVIFLSLSCVTALIACILICASHAFVQWHFAIVTAVLTFFTALFSLTGILLFARWSYESDYRFYIFITMNVEQLYGYSFYIAIAACCLFVLALLITGACVLMALKERRLYGNGNGNGYGGGGAQQWRPSANGRQAPIKSIVTDPYGFSGGGGMGGLGGEPEKIRPVSPTGGSSPGAVGVGGRQPQLTVTTVNYTTKQEDYPSYVRVNGFNRITPYLARYTIEKLSQMRSILVSGHVAQHQSVGYCTDQKLILIRYGNSRSPQFFAIIGIIILYRIIVHLFIGEFDGQNLDEKNKITVRSNKDECSNSCPEFRYPVSHSMASPSTMSNKKSTLMHEYFQNVMWQIFDLPFHM
uniref:Uncharacterized protein n=1 Tax=Romanomermis culicivorax TaxID=13658 RepID=A0A915JQP0_ROMCU